MSNLTLSEAIKIYKKVGARKNPEYLFNWLHNIYKFGYLPSIDLSFREILAEDKTKLTIFDVLVDDLSDNSDVRNKRLLDAATKLPFKNSKRAYKNPYLSAIKLIWDSCIVSIRSYPRYHEFKDLFFFDLHQILNSMRYSYLVNTMPMGNEIEDSLYLPFGVMVILHCDMDLMCSPNFDKRDLRYLRPYLYLAQEVSHIGNLLNTYPREVIEKDLSSPIISLAIRKGLITKNDFYTKEENIILEKLKPLEAYFKKKVNENVSKMRQYEKMVKSMDLSEFTIKIEKTFEYFLKRKKYWE